MYRLVWRHLRLLWSTNMSQHDFDIANQASAAARADINLALKALASQSSGSVAPTTTYANMLWYDTGNNILKMRAEADDAWINIAYLDQSADAFRLLDNTQVVNTSGTQTGLIGGQSTDTWEVGTSTTESLVSPAKIKAAAEANFKGVGVNQTWQDVRSSRVLETSYQNTTGLPIQVSLYGSRGGTVQVSENGSTWIAIGTLGQVASFTGSFQFVVPPSHYYRITGGSGDDTIWNELR